MKSGDAVAGEGHGGQGRAGKAKVIFQPAGRRGEVAVGKSVLEAARELGVDIESVCGEKKTCGKCKVRIEEGFFERDGVTSARDHVSPFTAQEERFVKGAEREQGYRLACTALIGGDLLVFVPEKSRAGKQVVRKAATARPVALKPAIRSYYVELPPATLDDPTADLERLTRELADVYGLDELTIDYPALLELPGALRADEWKVTVAVWEGREIRRVQPGYVETSYGLAIDIGTTTVAGFLCDLTTGEIVGSDALMNPQVTYGEDVMSRISYAMSHPDGVTTMHRAIVEAINTIAANAARAAGVVPEDILEVVVVGNTCMHHIFLNINPQHIGLSPFPPALQRACDLRARELCLRVNHGANVHVLPIEAGFVGADNVGALIAEELYNQDSMTLLVDVGTNGELVLGNRERLIAASCATGPALEGAHIKFGMRAAPGAIERVRIDPATGEVNYTVIGQPDEKGRPAKVGARGICGSGIIDAVAELFKAGVVDKTGRFNMGAGSPRLRRSAEGMPEFVLAWAGETAVGMEITVCQADVRAVQLAKAALYAGAKLLMRRMGVARLDKVVLAGAFGSYIDKTAAMTIGMFPYCDPAQVSAVGNAAGDGARIALLNVDKRREAAAIARRVEYVELTVEPGFEEEFVAAMHFPQC